MKKSASTLVLLLFLSTFMFSLPQIGMVKAESTIYIRADGSVEGTDSILQDGNIYTFLGNLSIAGSGIDGIIVERDNIVVDGAGYALEGAEGVGIVLSERSNVTIKNIELLGCEYGILLEGSTDNIIAGNIIKNNTRAIELVNSSGNHISDNHIIENEYAIIEYEDPSGNNIISGNTIKNNTIGISFSGNNNVISENLVTGNNLEGIGVNGNSTTLIGNNVTKNCMGIIIVSSNNVLRNNSIYDNDGNFSIGGHILTGGNFWIGGKNFVNDVDASNTFDGKPIIYWVNQHDKIVPSNAGYVALVNCTGITVKGLNLAYNGEGIVLAYTNNSKIIGNNIQFKRNGIVFWGSSNNYIVGNNITNNENGIYLKGWEGVNGSYVPSPNNFIYHNNFVDNQHAVRDVFYSFAWPENTNSPVNIWDNGYVSGGNYWSDYKGEDIYGNGIGATPYYIWRLNTPFPAPDTIDERNKDRYPVLTPINSFDAGTWEWNSYYVDVISNSTVSDFFFNPAEGAFIRFNATGANNTTGYCRVTIPKGLLSSENGLNVVVNGEPITPTIDENTENINLYFTYSHSTKTVEITGTNVIPEFPSWIILPLFIITALFVIVIKKMLASIT